MTPQGYKLQRERERGISIPHNSAVYGLIIWNSNLRTTYGIQPHMQIRLRVGLRMWIGRIPSLSLLWFCHFCIKWQITFAYSTYTSKSLPTDTHIVDTSVMYNMKGNTYQYSCCNFFAYLHHCMKLINREMLCCHAGDAPVCDPRMFYQCLKPALVEYVRTDEEANCNCPRQCCRLSYDYTVSQAEFSDFFTNFAKHVFQLNQSADAIKYDYCSLEVTFRSVALSSAQSVKTKIWSKL